MYKPLLQQYFRDASFPVDEWGESNFRLTAENVSELRSLDYVDRWRVSIDNGWFHVKTKDNSLLIFSEINGCPNYSFLHCPLDVPSYEEFLLGMDIEVSRENKLKYREDYEMELQTASLKKHLFPLRYDYAPGAYQAGLHPLGHIHIGISNPIRVAVRRTLTPLAFSLFVMRQMYPACWEKLLVKHAEHKLPRRVRDSLSQVTDDYWKDEDLCEMYLA